MAGLVLLATLASPCAGQWLEETIYLPDSLCGVVFPSCITASPTSNKVYVSGMHMDGYRRFGQDCWAAAIDASTDRIVARIPVPSEIASLCYNATDDRVYAFSYDADSTIAVIDAGTDSVVAAVSLGEYNYSTSICWNRALNKLYAQQGQNSSVAVIDCTGDTVLTTVETIRRPTMMVCAPEFNRVYCGNATPELAAIDCSADTVCARITLPAWPMSAAYDSAGGRVFVGDWRGNVVVIDPASDSIVASRDVGGRVSALCYIPVRDRLYCSQGDQLIVLDAASLAEVARIPLDRNWCETMCYDSRAGRVYCTGKERLLVHVVDCTTDSVVAAVFPGEGPVALCPSPQEVKVYCVNSGSDDLAVIAGDSVAARIAVGSQPGASVYNPARDKVYVANYSNGLVSVIDGGTNKVLANVRVGYRNWNICYASGADKVYCPSWLEGYVSVIDCATDTVVARVPVDTLPHYVAYSPEQNAVYCVNDDYHNYNICVIDCAADTVRARIRLPGKPYQPCYNSVGDKLYCDVQGYDTRVLSCSLDSIVGVIPGVQGLGVGRHLATYNKAYLTGGSSFHVVDGTADTAVALIESPHHGSSCDACFNTRMSKVYLSFAPNPGGGPDVMVVDAVTDSVLKVIRPQCPTQVCYNAMNNKVYVSEPVDPEPPYVSIIDCGVDEITRQIPVGRWPHDMVWNPVANRVYVSNWLSGSVSVIRDSIVPGVAEGPPVAVTPAPLPTILRNVLVLPRDMTDFSPGKSGRVPRHALMDACGRKVLDLHAGENDISHLSPGVYFVHSRVASRQSQPATRVVVLK